MRLFGYRRVLIITIALVLFSTIMIVKPGQDPWGIAGGIGILLTTFFTNDVIVKKGQNEKANNS
jgi:hypothetical protein